MKSVRGLEARTIAKLEQDGWEIMSQTQGRLQSEIRVRRATKPLSRRTLAIGGSVVAALAVVIVLGATGVFGDESGDASVAASASASVSAPAPAPSESAQAQTDEPTDIAVLTGGSNQDLADLLQLTNTCDPSIGRFADEYAGRTVSFDGSIGAMNLHGSASTRYDILIGAGDYSTTESDGPAFQFRDVNTVADLHYVGDTPGTIGVGTNLTVTATVGEYEPQTCLFLLEPVTTVVR
ncbi:DUF4839 domain-containing protein [Curtobacterium sp. PhB115]|uniref:DUF4839 domain-containing protein n=1 Tax=Curtobacterium sp. PhB115 TaxID=2485173 RepID=UPI0016183531|nr:DUF4839 domain-containing protein [Curtobacterium sp. PhB115]